MITRKMRLSMAMLTIAASVLTTGNIKADEKDTTNETNTATESKYANKAVAILPFFIFPTIFAFILPFFRIFNVVVE